MNPDRKKGGDLNKVTYEAFEIIMDRLEKEWIDLVRILGVHLFRAARTILNFWCTEINIRAQSTKPFLETCFFATHLGMSELPTSK